MPVGKDLIKDDSSIIDSSVISKVNENKNKVSKILSQFTPVLPTFNFKSGQFQKSAINLHNSATLGY